jgi:tRNA modification GTPase
VADLREACLDLLAKVEASTDFSEEIGDFDYEAASAKVREIKPVLDQLLADAKRSEIVRRGFRIAIVGRPNVGKSSLLNALVKRDRAIVTNIAGTTRDTLEESIDLRGRKAVFIDTAGLHDTTDVVELLGIERTRQEISGADLTILLFDLETGWTDEDQKFARQFRDALIVGNKLDLAKPGAEVAIGISASEGLGLERLLDVIEHKMSAATPKTLVNERHAALLQVFAATLDELETALQSLVPSDLLSTLLREGIHTLGQISGETASPDMIDEIFRRFCIGK